MPPKKRDQTCKTSNGSLERNSEACAACSQAGPSGEPSTQQQCRVDSQSSKTAEDDDAEKWVQTQRSSRRKAGEATDKTKLTPACDSCKRSKIRCRHRRAVSANEELSEQAEPPVKTCKRKAKVESPESKVAYQSEEESQELARSALKKIKLRCGSQDKGKGKEREVAEAEPEAEPAMPAKRPRGRPRKHQIIEDTPDPILETTPPPKRTKWDCKATEKASASETVDAPGSSAAARSRGFSASDSLDGSAQLSVHAVLSRELGEKLEECETNWRAAIDSLSEAKGLLDNWVEAWRKGQ
ncbi:hypothetical protein EYZ11_012947 [Aspergillus tanneri]|uniref:Zn(2)-C6 fungal-type domain-containing protein n=1 Tax=Aspergillus tanneri TaxID=1220188 RepID=A0A4S3IYX8_9EURO|nr:uncharacterized protein ATNIH1004_001345 [Aspergillus tanneri]KAA8652441.1 hypothetical protein ATNIH1004_001345 [Aspergillus tanneri]THC87610.1 hypothetical protein EYZ11_012947 [Aspergillus tanneri]